jgi:hypothetical protein
VGRDAWGADFDWDRPADLELDPARLLRPNPGTINSEPRNTIAVMKTSCLWFRMSSLLSLAAEPAFAFSSHAKQHFLVYLKMLCVGEFLTIYSYSFFGTLAGLRN